jgi:N-acetylglucosaminylphosphatidylinositol deacetylase
MLPLTPFVVLFLAAFLYAPLSSDLETIDNDGASRVLLLTAHPDDEAMFFAPTILALNANANKRSIPRQVDASGQTVLSQPDRATSNLFSLCLSTGNAEGLGAIRTEELSQSLDVLGIGRGRRWVVDNPYVIEVFVLHFHVADLPLRHLQDNITADWDPHAISGIIKTYILEHGITTVCGHVPSTVAFLLIRGFRRS